MLKNPHRPIDYKKPGLPEGAPRNITYVCVAGCGQVFNEFRNKEGNRNVMCPNCYTDGSERFVDPETGREMFKILMKNELTNRNNEITKMAVKAVGATPGRRTRTSDA